MDGGEREKKGGGEYLYVTYLHNKFDAASSFIPLSPVPN